MAFNSFTYEYPSSKSSGHPGQDIGDHCAYIRSLVGDKRVRIR